MTRLAFGAIAPQTQENTVFLRAQGLKHYKTRVLEGPRLEPGGGGAASLATRENNDLALKNKVLPGFWSLSAKAGGCRPLKN